MAVRVRLRHLVGMLARSPDPCPRPVVRPHPTRRMTSAPPPPDFSAAATDPAGSDPDAPRSGRRRRRGGRSEGGEASGGAVGHRAAFRARQHAAAHDEGGDDGPDLPPADAAEWVDSDDKLAGVVERLRAAGTFAYDSEFIGEQTYHPVLCLVQAATDDFCALIDPTADLDLTPFWELVADGSVRKLVHAGEQDLEPVVRLIGQAPANIFDTQVAAAFAGMAYPLSLSKLVKAATGAELAKGFTFTDWLARPLSRKQLRYAADDVRYLPAVAAYVEDRFVHPRAAEWASAECAERCDPARFGFDPADVATRVKGYGSLDGRQSAVALKLIEWRDSAARAANLPPRAFVKDEVVVSLARLSRRAAAEPDLAGIKFMPRPVASEHGQSIRDALAAGWSAEPVAGTGRPPEPTPQERFASDAALSTAGAIAFGAGVDLAVIANRADLAEFHAAVASGGDGSGTRVMAGWRREALGDALRAVLTGGRTVEVAWRDGRPHL